MKMAKLEPPLQYRTSPQWLQEVRILSVINAKKVVFITRIWKWAMNFAIKSKYTIPAINCYYEPLGLEKTVYTF